MRAPQTTVLNVSRFPPRREEVGVRSFSGVATHRCEPTASDKGLPVDEGRDRDKDIVRFDPTFPTTHQPIYWTSCESRVSSGMKS